VDGPDHAIRKQGAGSTCKHPAVKIGRVTQRPDLQPSIHDRRRSAMFLSLGLTVAGGLLGWSLVFVGLGLWGLLVGAAVVVLLMVAVGRRDAGQDRLFAMVGYGMAFVLLTWLSVGRRGLLPLPDFGPSAGRLKARPSRSGVADAQSHSLADNQPFRSAGGTAPAPQRPIVPLSTRLTTTTMAAIKARAATA